MRREISKNIDGGGLWAGDRSLQLSLLWKVNWTQTLTQTNLEAQNTHKQFAKTPKYLLCNPHAFCLFHPCISNLAYQQCCSLKHRGHILYFQDFVSSLLLLVFFILPKQKVPKFLSVC